MGIVFNPDAFRSPTAGVMVTSTDLPGGVVVLHVVGEIDLDTGADLLAGIDRALDDQPTVLVMDLSSVSFLGSAGVAALVSLNRRAPRTPLPVVVSPAIRRLLCTVGIDEDLSLHDRLDEALPTTDTTPGTGPNV